MSIRVNTTIHGLENAEVHHPFFSEKDSKQPFFGINIDRSLAMTFDVDKSQALQAWGEFSEKVRQAIIKGIAEDEEE